MDSLIARVYLCSISLALCLTAKAEAGIVFKILESGLQLDPDSRVSIGHVSDVFTDIQCLLTGDESDVKQWLLQPDAVPLPSPFTLNQTSFSGEDGILRVYSQFIQTHATDRVLTLQCSTSGPIAADLHIELSPTFFFDEALPSEITPSQDLASLCAESLPTLPVHSLSVESDTSSGGTTYSYCTVDTARGKFRSKSVVTGGTYRFSMLRFQREFPPEQVEWVVSGEDSDPIRLPCQIGGATTQGLPLVFFLRNGEMISPDGGEDGVTVIVGSLRSFQVLRVERRKGNEGLYQCVGQAGDDTSTLVVTSTYINLKYLEQPAIGISSDSPTWRPDTVLLLAQSDTPQKLVLNCSVEAHPIPTFYWTRTDGNTWIEVQGRQGRTGYRERAFSVLRVPVSQLIANVGFTCTAVIGDRTRNISMSITAYSQVQFTETPREVASSPVPLLSCSASSIPNAHISWFQVSNNGAVREVTDRDVGVSIHEELDDNTVRSTLQLPPISDLSVTGYYCRGNNGFSSVNSNTLELLQSVPGAPEILGTVLSANSVAVEWTPPPSLLPLDQYTVTLYQSSSTDRELQSVAQPASRETRLVFQDLRPFTVYTVEVVATNIAGNNASSGRVSLKTLEAAPEAAPENVVAEAKDTDKIRVSWSPPTPNLTNGVIRSYSIIYRPTSDPTLSLILNNLQGPEADINLPMGAGLSYVVKVAAYTVARGPFSEGVVQMTYPLPPSFPPDPPIMVPGIEVSQNTIPIQLPSVNKTQFSHFWVVVVRLDDRGTPHSDITQAAIIPVSPPTDPPETNAPYVVAEMSAETYQENRELFVIGDEEKTQELNDFPELYRNLPLLPGSTYTAFVRGFAHFIPPSRMNTRARKQAEEMERQYTVFSSSELLPVTATLSAAEGDVRGSQLEVVSYVAIGVGCTLVLLVVIFILVITRKLRALGRKHTDDMKNGGRQLSSRGQSSSNNNDGTLPRGLTVTGEGIKYEEHIYEDPLHLKSCEAYSDTEPMYKVPRPVSCDEDDMRGDPCANEVGYEIIPLPTLGNRKSTKSSDGRNRESPHDLGTELASGSVYELMQHPSSLGKGSTLSLPTTSPTPYLKPVGISDRHGIAAGFDLLQQTSDKHDAANSPQDKGILEGSTYNYANVAPVEAKKILKTSNSFASAGNHEPTEYVVMKSATLKHQ